MKFLQALLGFFGGDFADQLRRAYEAKLNAENDADRLVAESNVRALEIAQANRLASADNWGIQFAAGMLAIALSAHITLVAFVSAFPFWGWTIHALPTPMDEWEGTIILGLFGGSLIGKIFRK